MTKRAVRKPAGKAVSAKARPGKAAAAKQATQKGTRTGKPSRVRGTAAAAVQRIAGSRPWAADENDPIALLEADHRRLEELLESGEKTGARATGARTELLQVLTQALRVHERIEEEILYPALAPHTAARDVVLEGFEEHHVADVLVRELHELAKDHERWGAKFKVLKENIAHHIEEEEGEMFPAARRVLSREQLQALGARMRQLKAEAERQGSGER